MPEWLAVFSSCISTACINDIKLAALTVDAGAFLKQYVHHCPKELYETAVIPLLAQFCPALHRVTLHCCCVTQYNRMRSWIDNGPVFNICRTVQNIVFCSTVWNLWNYLQWFSRSTLCCHPLPALTDNWTHGAASRHTQAATLGLHLVGSVAQ